MDKNIQRIKGLLRAVIRFPVTGIFLFLAFCINGIDIQMRTDDYRRYFFTLIVGVFLTAAAQMIYERFCKKGVLYPLFMGGALLLDIGYYFMIDNRPVYSTDIIVITTVAAFALLITFIWVPVIHTKFDFNESFMSAFKSFFISFFFATMILIGVSLVIGAVDQLLFRVKFTAYSHVINAVYVLFAPIYFLSLTPRYERKENEDEDIRKAVSCPKYLEILLSYIVIPITAVFTGILLIYIFLNARQGFWTDNLLEPMLVSYAITVIVVYILVSKLNNYFVKLFQKIFPKILVPVVIFQTLASVLKIREMGVTYGRYYAILFGVFAIISGVIFIVKPLGRNGAIAAGLISLSVFSIIPPVDAFTVSRINQVVTLKKVLEKNQMLEDGRIIPSSSVSVEDQAKIKYTVGYLRNMNYISEYEWLSGYTKSYNFEGTFGFSEYGFPDSENQDYQYVGVNMEQGFSVEISGSDSFSFGNISVYENNMEETLIGETVLHDKTYALMKSIEKGKGFLILKDEEEQEIIRFPMEELVNRFQDYGSEKGNLTSEEATFLVENDQARMMVIVQNFYMSKVTDSFDYNVDFYVFYKIK